MSCNNFTIDWTNSSKFREITIRRIDKFNRCFLQPRSVYRFSIKGRKKLGINFLNPSPLFYILYYLRSRDYFLSRLSIIPPPPPSIRARVPFFSFRPTEKTALAQDPLGNGECKEERLASILSGRNHSAKVIRSCAGGWCFFPRIRISKAPSSSSSSPFLHSISLFDYRIFS